MQKGTRESNKKFKGGELHKKYDRRSTADVQAEKATKNAEKARKATARAQGEQRAAQVELDALQKTASRIAKPGAVYDKTPTVQKKDHKRPGSVGGQGLLSHPWTKTSLLTSHLISLS
jgi:hypothetical protein